MGRTIHISQSIQGALQNWKKKDWDSMGADNGMTGSQLRERLRIMDFEGKKLIPSPGCGGFSYEHGCPGHEKED